MHAGQLWVCGGVEVQVHVMYVSYVFHRCLMFLVVCGRVGVYVCVYAYAYTYILRSRSANTHRFSYVFDMCWGRLWACVVCVLFGGVVELRVVCVRVCVCACVYMYICTYLAWVGWSRSASTHDFICVSYVLGTPVCGVSTHMFSHVFHRCLILLGECVGVCVYECTYTDVSLVWSSRVRVHICFHACFIGA
jgi:hypothetical protein